MVAAAPVLAFSHIKMWQTYWITINAVAFLIYAVDKVAAQSGGWRIPEIVLLALALLGGWSGAIFSQQLFRHKTSKVPFQILFIISTAVNIRCVYVYRNEIFT